MKRRRSTTDPGLEALVTLLHSRVWQLIAGSSRHRWERTRSARRMLRCAKDLGLKARAYRTDGRGLPRRPCPLCGAA